MIKAALFLTLALSVFIVESQSIDQDVQARAIGRFKRELVAGPV